MNNIATINSQEKGNSCSNENKLKLKVLQILAHTKCEFEKILDSTGKVLVYEGLARPNPNNMDLPNSNLHPDKAALIKLLELVENTDTSFLLFVHMLGEIGKVALSKDGNKSCFSINAYAADVENPLFLRTIKECSFADRLTIELTEKKKWSIEAINNLIFIQKKYGVKIAMDDIDPTVSSTNYSMKNLEKFKNHYCYVDSGKIDGQFFQDAYKRKNYDKLKNLILFNHQEYKIRHFDIEWIEELDQYNFAKQLELDFPYFTFGYQGFLFKDNNF